MKPNASCKPVPAEALLPFLLELIKEGKTVDLTGTGHSMMPLWYDGRDSVLLVEPKKIKPLDVVLFIDENNKPILHRIVSCRKNGYMIVGDNQNKPDGPIKKEQIKAVVVGFCRAGRNHAVTELWYRIYSFFWGYFRPFRRFIFPFLGKSAKLMKRMERK